MCIIKGDKLRDRQRERERDNLRWNVCICVCIIKGDEREREREREREEFFSETVQVYVKENRDFIGNKVKECVCEY